MPLKPPISLFKFDFNVSDLSIVELLITKPSILLAKLINAISLICSSSISGAILKKIGVLSKECISSCFFWRVCTSFSILPLFCNSLKPGVFGEEIFTVI